MSTPEERVAYIQAQTACAMIEMQSMIAANHEREQQGHSHAYDEEAFYALIEKYGIHHNAVVGLFHDA